MRKTFLLLFLCLATAVQAGRNIIFETDMGNDVDDAWALDFYFAHKDDTTAELVHAVLTNTQMWDQDLTRIEGLEAAVLEDLELIRTQGAEAAYKSCL